ncbi:hypothetical protein PUR31_13360 [Pseudomonas mosselii]|uniref:hypothetical protein n=1 Tax=unclassified Pseudomonas TaxID=196821 RepID=UPI0020C59B86|nr:MULTISPECIES: hypothetical protein [unclassified Pseudomonas]MCP8633688.1 hypothetical protein [Pseudomonas sp. DVZ6]MDD7785074.1 hypothetical protein [Pseudomonas sp. DVZ24]
MSILERLRKEIAQANSLQRKNLIFEVTEEEFEGLKLLAASGNGGDVVNNGFMTDPASPNVQIMVNGQLRVLTN